MTNPPKDYTEIEVPAITLQQLPPHTWVKKYKRGKISVIVSLEVEDGFHLSISYEGGPMYIPDIIHAIKNLIPKNIKMTEPKIICYGSTVYHSYEVK